MQLIFYKVNDKVTEMARTPMVADSIHIPVPQIDELVTMDNFATLRGGNYRKTYIVTGVEHVYADTVNLNVVNHYVKVYLRDFPSKVASDSPQ